MKFCKKQEKKDVIKFTEELVGITLYPYQKAILQTMDLASSVYLIFPRRNETINQQYLLQQVLKELYRF